MKEKAVQRVAILVRVSTDKQDTARQVSELEAVAESRGWKVVEVIKEGGVSGAAKVRPGLDRVKELAIDGNIHKVLVHEVSRIARRPAVVHPFVEVLHESGVSLYWHAQRIETLLDDGKRNPAAGMMLAILAEMAMAERETLTERIKSGLTLARKRGKRLGRPTGTGLSPEAFLAKHEDIAGMLERKKSVRDVASRTGKSTGTVMKVKGLLS